MATRDLTRRFAELRVLQHGVEGSAAENKRPGDAFSESGLLDVSGILMRHVSCSSKGISFLLSIEPPSSAPKMFLLSSPNREHSSLRERFRVRVELTLL